MKKNSEKSSQHSLHKRGKNASLGIALAIVTLVLVASPASAGILRLYAVYQSLPIEGVQITLTDTDTGEQYNTTTEANGTATIDLPPGTYEMTATSNDYTTPPKTIQVDESNTTTLLEMNTNESESDDEDSGSTGLIIALLIVGGLCICLFIYYLTVQKDLVLGIFNSSSATEFAKSPDKDERAGNFLGGLLGGGTI